VPSRYVRFHDGHPSPSQNRTWKLPGRDQSPTTIFTLSPTSQNCRRAANWADESHLPRVDAGALVAAIRAVDDSARRAGMRSLTRHASKKLPSTDPSVRPRSQEPPDPPNTKAIHRSPLSDSNRRPLPYHGEPPALISRICWGYGQSRCPEFGSDLLCSGHRSGHGCHTATLFGQCRGGSGCDGPVPTTHACERPDER